MNPEKIFSLPSQKATDLPAEKTDQLFNDDYQPTEEERKKWEKEDKIYEYYENFLSNIKNDDYHTKLREHWHDNFSNNPTKFFSPENYQELRKLDSADRLAKFYKSTSSLYVTPDMVNGYFKEFPDDLEAATIMFRDHNGIPDTNNMLAFFNTCATALYNHKNLEHIKPRKHNQYLAAAERKNLAPQVLMGDYEIEGKLLPELFAKFGQAAEGFFAAHQKASDLVSHGEHFINPKQIFTPEFEKLNEKDKADFLRKTTSVLHNDLIFEEVWNSHFTKESMTTVFNKKNSFGPSLIHSYIFKTYQPLSSFYLNQRYFDYEMNNTASGGGAIEEYPFEKLLLASINRLGKATEDKDKNTDLLVDFWNKNRNPIFANAVADALSKQNPTRAAGKLLNYLKQEKEDKRALAAILYRLELGQINLSKEGALYLEKMYDLGLHNNPDYHISRLTPNGEIGIFNEEKELIKYFELGDLTSEDKKITAQVLDITYDTLFFPKDKETKEEENQRLLYLQEFKKHYYNLAQDQIFKETDVQLNNLSFKEQGWFLINLNNSQPEEKNKLLEFTKQYQEEGIKTFLSLNQDEKIGYKILTIGKKLKDNGADLIFKKYSSITNYLNNLQQDVQNYFTDQNKSQNIDSQKITNNLLTKAQQILIKYANQIEQGQDITYEQISQELKNVSEEIILFAAVFKETVQQQPEINLADFKNINLTISKPTELSSQDKTEIMRVYQANRPNYPEKLLNITSQELQETLSSPDKRFYLLKINNELTSFVRFDDLPNGHTYIGSFNVRPEAKSSLIGDALLKTALTKEGQYKNLEGLVYAKHPQLDNYLKYLEKMGFSKTGQIDNYKNTGEQFIKIERLANPPLKQAV